MNTPSSREVAIFNAARRLPADQRAAYLNELCSGDALLRERVEELLNANDAAGAFLKELAAGTGDVQAPPGPGGTIRVEPNLFENPGDRIGRYKLLEKVGEGGCGIVYVAEQTEPVRRRVALKVIKLGMDTKAVIARFEAERQALAMMDHPNIAKVLDAGTTETGRPYFVMELVRGIRITDYCDQTNLSTEQRLGLFIKVCQAIQHAHQKGIIHRDVKPSNILVTLHDGVPVPKVIDFGIAKATEGRLTDATVYTQLHQFIGTPAYMSPEQAEMSGLDIDTRSDIYSLGVLLYELLVGSTPFDANELMASGLDAMRKTIREKEPVRPSTRFATLQGEELTTAARRRSCDVPRLVHLLKGDLDWIVMKCLEKDRARRYETANGLAADLKRHLEDEPVVARPPSMAYRFQKAFLRNKVAFSAGVAVFLALAAGLTVAAMGWRATRVERDAALQARAAEEAERKAAQASEQKAETAETGQIHLREQAQAQALAARRIAYSSDMNLVQQALAMNNLGRAQMLLNRQKPQPGQLDLRGWEWRYLWSQTRPDDHEVLFAETNPLDKSLSFSADGHMLARETTGVAVVTDLTSRSTVWQRTNSWRPVFAHHGATLAFCDSSSTNVAVTLLDLDTQQETQIVTNLGHTIWLGFTPDDRRLLTVSYRTDPGKSYDLPYSLAAWDIDTRSQLWRREIGRAAGSSSVDYYRSYAISPDGTAVAAVLSQRESVQVLETQNGTDRFTIHTTDEYATTAAFSPDSSTLLTGAGFTESSIRLWDAHTGKAAGSLEGHHSFVSDLLFTPDGKQLISSSGDQTIRLWDWSTRQPAGVLRGHLTEVVGLALAPDGRTLASRCKDGSIYLWDVTKPSRHLGYQILPSLWEGWNIEFTPDSRSILQVVGPPPGVVQWDALTLKETRRSWKGPTNDNAIFLSPDASRVALLDHHGGLHLWDVGSGVESTRFIAATNRFALDFSQNWKFFATARADGTNLVVDVWDTGSWQPHGSLITELDGARDIDGTPVPNTFVILNSRGFLFFDATKLNEAPKQIECDRFDDLDVSSDGRIAAAAYSAGYIQLWDMATGQPTGRLKGFLLGTHSVAFSSDGKRLAAGSNGQEAVKLWDTETWQEVLTLSGVGSVFHVAKFSPDGRYLLAVNLVGTIHLWSAPTWDEIKAAEEQDAAARN
jgi:serine/threonine protein kinase/WD40 repeat protein